MKKKWIYIIIACIIIISNLPIISTAIMEQIDNNRFKYANNDASFALVQDFDLFRKWINQEIVRNFISDTRPELDNMEVYRLYKINPLCFWRWRYYLFISTQFDFKSWEEIEPNRVPYDPSNMWQDF